MHIKRFREKTLEKALRGVKSAFGEDAVILSTKQGKDVVEVMAAVDFDIEEIERKFGDTAANNGLDSLKNEIAELRSLFSTVVRDTAIREIAAFGGGALKLYQWMLERGVNERLAQSLIKKAAASSNGDRDMRDRCYSLMLEKATVYNPLSQGERPRLLALFGPTGAGKTTTIAKLAGVLTQKYKAKVGVVSIDSMRPGGNESLKLYGQRFGFPLTLPKNKEDFNKALWNSRDRDIILIDTPGKNPKDTNAITKLRGMLNGGLPIKAGLVLSVTSRDEVLNDACKGFGRLPIDYLVFTKIDEARQFGSILNTLTHIKKPIAYLCNGQMIPRDIGVASRKALGNLFTGKEVGHG